LNRRLKDAGDVDLRRAALLQGFSEIGSALRRTSEFGGGKAAIIIEPCQLAGRGPGRWLAVGRGAVGRGFGRIGFLFIEDRRDIGDAARGRREVLTLESGRDLLCLVQRYRSLLLTAGEEHC
jgi:hypothetical protein